MISQLLYTLERGLERIKANTKLLFLVVVLFVFPLLFILVLEQFFTVATANIRTVENQYIAGVHDSAAATVQYSVDDIALVLSQIKARNPDLVGYRIYQGLDTTTVLVVATSAEDEYLATSTMPTLLRTTLQEVDQTFSTTVTLDGARLIQAARQLPSEGSQLFLYTEHSFAAQDLVFEKRKQSAYILLSFIFLFVIALAYWISRQSDWERKHNRLSQVLAERDLFSNMIAHEFRTPLTAIKGYASFIQDSDTASAEDQRYATTINDSAQRLILLVNDFLEVARIQSGKLTIKTSELDIRSTISQVVDSLNSEADKKGLQLIYTPSLQPQLLTTDANRFIQILTNIASNSVKYTESGTVEISCEQDRSGVTIRVKDTGMGISALDQRKLFAPFARVGGVEKTNITGTGLGMWITKQMIELLDGTIAVESIQGVGTHVVLTFANNSSKS